MKRLLTIAGGCLAALAVFISLRAMPQASASGIGPQIVVGAPSLVAGKVNVPINTAGSGFVAYSGFNIRLKWDPTVFSFSSANSTGSVIPGSPFCPPANTSLDPGGDGVVFACTGLSGPTTSTGLLATIVLTPAASGCSALHLFTFGPPDGGTSGSGTFTNNPTPMTNTYQDGTANVAGMTCSPGATPTPTNTAIPTPTNTTVPTTPTSATGTATPFGGFRTVTPTFTATSSPAAGATQAPGGTTPPGGGTQPGGGPGGTGTGPTGTITLPNTGARQPSGVPMFVQLLAVISAFAIGTGAAAAGLRRLRRR